MSNKQVAGLGTRVPPQIDYVKIYFDQQDLPEEAQRFFSQHERNKWKTETGKPLKNWKTEAAKWIWKIKLRNPHMRF